MSEKANLGSGWQFTIHPDDLDEHLSKWQASLETGAPFENEARQRDANGEYRWFLVRAVPLRDEHGNVLKWYGTLTDIEDRKRSEQERERFRQLQADLAHENRVSMMGELAASLSHELKQPIAAAITDAKTCLRWLTRDQPDVEEAREATMRTVKDGTRAAEIIDRLRSFYKKGAPPERELVDVNELVREMLVLLRSEADRYSISLRTDLAAELPKVTGRSRATAAGTDEPHAQWHRCDEGRGWGARTNHQVTASGKRATSGVRQRHRRGSAAAAGGPDLQCVFYHQASRHRHGTSRSAAPSLNRMVAVCGLPLTLRAAPTFISRYPQHSGTSMTDGRASEYVLEPLREGADFTLYRGRQHGNPSPVLAIALSAEHPSPQSLRRLEHEYSLAAELDPAWAAKPLALTRHEGRTILVLKDPGGEPLDLVLERDQGQPLDLTRFLRIAIGLASALGQVHRRGLIHKDIKPANVLVNDAGNVWLTGFGIASQLPQRAPVARAARRSLPARSPTWRPNRPAA